MRYGIVLFAVFMNFIPETAFSEINVISRAFSAEHWKSFPWKSVESSTYWNSEEFKELSIDEKNATTRRFARGKFEEKALVLMQRLYLGRDLPKHSFVLSTSKIGGCSWLNNELSEKFGPPIQSFDESHNYAGSKSERNLWYWIVGKTAVVQECFTILGDEQFVFANFFEIDKKYMPSSPIHLTCTQEVEVSQYPGASKEIEPLAITIHPYYRHILNEADELLSMGASISEKEIAFSMRNNEASIEYKISRVTGLLSGAMKKSGNSQNVFGQVRGNCTSRDPDARKF